MTAPAYPHKIATHYLYKNLYKYTSFLFFEDGHSNRVIPDPIPNSEVKAITLFVLVADKLRSSSAVSLYFFMKNLSKKDAEKRVADFFLNIKNKTSKQIKKIKVLAMNKKISLKKYRKFFCKNCLTPYSGKEKIRIKKGIKSVECLKCKKINRWKIK